MYLLFLFPLSVTKYQNRRPIHIKSSLSLNDLWKNGQTKNRTLITVGKFMGKLLRKAFLVGEFS